MGSTSPGWDERGQLQLRPSSHGATDNSRQLLDVQSVVGRCRSVETAVLLDAVTAFRGLEIVVLSRHTSSSLSSWTVSGAMEPL
jgi:hypothetical protein